jgi:hypothetical protein
MGGWEDGRIERYIGGWTDGWLDATLSTSPQEEEEEDMGASDGLDGFGLALVYSRFRRLVPVVVVAVVVVFVSKAMLFF